MLLFEQFLEGILDGDRRDPEVAEAAGNESGGAVQGVESVVHGDTGEDTESQPDQAGMGEGGVHAL